ncbi:vWA domain-containing protein [Vallitalea okinawensis]|uniref:vWA domain-containing protein n=1 Tax=Vallitalea okinawensis TaxID=2078660 RepID=UPI001FA8BF37|nr:VWA domain-containing protein [Vallitalea okinawensis]
MMRKLGIFCLILMLCLTGCSNVGNESGNGSDKATDTKQDYSNTETKATKKESKEESVEEESIEAPAEKNELTIAGLADENMAEDKCVIIEPIPSNSEEYSEVQESDFIYTTTMPLSTFSIDVDTASYSQVRRYLTRDQQLPPIEAVRIEEMINYFSYDYPKPKGDDPFSVYTEVGVCPWNKEHYLAMIGVQGKEVSSKKRPASNLVFLLDVSGSMNDPYKLPLLKSAFSMLTNELTEKDNVSIVVYAGASGVVLEGAEGADKDKINEALYQLSAGGSTAGGEGIELAYKLANKYFIEGGNNRVILATDGDFNVGISSEEGLEKLIEEKREEDIFLSVLGFGTGNIKDNKMEVLADKGNGNYAYIDSIEEAEKVLVSEMAGTLFTIAKDVKLQLEFNPAKVGAYRLVGYDNRRLNNEDFADDTKDAGDIGMGHTVTAFYEIIPVDQLPEATSLRYQDNNELQEASIEANKDEWLYLKLRYKEPDSDTSQLEEYVVSDRHLKDSNTEDYNFAAAVAECGLLLRESTFKGDADWDDVLKRARLNMSSDDEGYKAEFIHLVEIAKHLSY